MLLSQHHFQQQDRYHERLLQERLSAVLSCEWGVTECEFDETALNHQEFRLTRFAAVWPDGTSVRCDGSAHEPRPAGRSFHAAFAASERLLPVYLGLAVGVDRGSIGEAEDAGRRYVRAVRSVGDDADPSHEIEVEWARPNLKLFFGAENQAGYSTLKVAELVRDATGKILARDTYVPPVTSLGAAPFLRAGLQRVLTASLARQRELFAQRSRRQSGQLSFHATDMRRFWLLDVLGGAVPVLSHQLESKRTRPEELYLALVALAGRLATFAEDAEPAPLPPLDHVNLGEVFEVVFARVLALLSMDLEPAYRRVELERRSDGMCLGQLGADVARELFVAVHCELPEDLVRDRLPRVLKMADWSQIYDLVKQSRPGLRIEPEWNPSGALPLAPKTHFFKVQRVGEVWKGIERSATVALFLPPEGDWKNAAIHLYAIDAAHLE